MLCALPEEAVRLFYCEEVLSAGKNGFLSHRPLCKAGCVLIKNKGIG